MRIGCLRPAVASAALALFVLVSPAAPGPTGDEAEAQVSVRGGFNLSDLVGSGVEGADGRRGVNAGVGISLLSLGPLSLRPEIHYVQKGTGSARLSGAGGEMGMPPGVEIFDQFALDYVEVPVLVRLAFPLPVEGDHLRGYVEGGPAFAWRVDCRIVPTAEGEVALNDECAFARFEDVESVVDAADQGAAMGLGVLARIPMVGEVSLDARLTRGLTVLSDAGDGLEARNQAFSLSLGYALAF